MTTPFAAYMVSLGSGRTAEEKSADFITATDYGASSVETTTNNTAAINAALATASTGFVVVPAGVTYTEASLVIPDDVVLLVFGEYGTLTALVKDFSAAPIAKGGFVVKSQGHTGVLLRAVDNGVATDPLLQLVDATSGDIAAAHIKFLEVDEVATTAAPAANKVRLYAKDDGSGNTELIARFATGTDIAVTKQGSSASLTGTVVYDPASLADGTGVTTTVTVTGAVLGDLVVASFSLDLQGIIMTSYVSAADTVSVRFQNETAGVIDLGNGTITAKVLRSRL